LEKFFTKKEAVFAGKVPDFVGSAIIDIGVVISKQGQVVVQRSLHGQNQAWWPQFQEVRGYILNKSETPFAHLYSGYYEAELAKKQ